MKFSELSSGEKNAFEQVLGYINFSSGSPDAAFYSNLRTVNEAVEQDGDLLYVSMQSAMLSALDELNGSSGVLSSSNQARTAVELVFSHVIPSFLTFHQQVLNTHDVNETVNTFFIGRVFDVVLKLQDEWENPVVADQAVHYLNDFVGYRPIATLETHRHEPYPHERIRPVPLYIANAGVCSGPFQELIELTIDLLKDTNESILRRAFFDINTLDELAYDPRSYDFDHPSNKRPNHQFGMWDPNQINSGGFYDRFVIQKVTLDAVLKRVNESRDMEYQEALLEGAAVLAGTILMASGISGNSPGCHASETTLSKLMPYIASYRDDFYDSLIERLSSPHVDRLKREAAERLQPFGAARQELNACLTKTKAQQLEHVHLAQVFAFIGQHDAAQKQVEFVKVSSARTRCKIACLLDDSAKCLETDELERASENAKQIYQLILDGIEHGSLIDPWNILGFDANFSLFPALENSSHDHRADELIVMVEQLFALLARIWSEASATNNHELVASTESAFQENSKWWRQFAAHTVSSVSASDPQQLYTASSRVAAALNAWQQDGAAAGNIGFWAPFADSFDSPKAYSLVIHTLIRKKDLIASMALLVHWLSRSEDIPLEQSESSFYLLARRWLDEARNVSDDKLDAGLASKQWTRIRKFFDFLEANAEELWRVPEFLIDHEWVQEEVENQDDTLEDDLYGAAYEHFTYRDTTDDGIDGSIFENNNSDQDELIRAGDFIDARLTFLDTVANLWSNAVLNQCKVIHELEDVPTDLIEDTVNSVRQWTAHTASFETQLNDLVQFVRSYEVAEPQADHESMIEYDRLRVTLDSLLERIISSMVEIGNTSRLLQATSLFLDHLLGKEQPQAGAILELDELTQRVFAAVLAGDANAVREHWSLFKNGLLQCPLLYARLNRGGSPQKIATSRIRQHVITDLLRWLPRLGLIWETCDLIEIARDMERNHPVGPGAVTEFDTLFSIGYQSLVEYLIENSADMISKSTDEETLDVIEEELVRTLEKVTESLLVSWLSHSQTLQLSRLEIVSDPNNWDSIIQFIKDYGEELFTQHFLAMGNIRGILLQGVPQWLDSLQADGYVSLKLLDDLESGQINVADAAKYLDLILESIVENYHEYRDYNGTTTQSDQGDKLYMLLDFIRLRAKYDRICWNLRPVILAHKILVSHEREHAAETWRNGLADRISDEADSFENKLNDLQSRYSMRMQSVCDRLSERFVQPMAIDFMRSLVKPSINDAESDPETVKTAFEKLKTETEKFLQSPSGSGVDVPEWLLALEEEVEILRSPFGWRLGELDLKSAVPPQFISFDDICTQLDNWADEQN